MLSVWIFLATFGGGLFAGAAYLLIGGLGVARELRGRIVSLELEIDDTKARLMSEVKKRAAQASVEARNEQRSMADLRAEAERLRAGNTESQRPVVRFGSRRE